MIMQSIYPAPFKLKALDYNLADPALNVTVAKYITNFEI